VSEPHANNSTPSDPSPFDQGNDANDSPKKWDRPSHRPTSEPKPPQDDGTTLQAWAIGIGLVALLVIVFGGFMVKFASDEYAISQWPTTEGTITGGRVTEREVEGGITTELNLRYSYQVDGREYTGTRYAPDASSVPGFSAAEAQTRFKVGTKKPILYNPAAPSESYWQSDFDENNLWKSWAIVVVGVAPLLVSVVLFRMSRRKAPPPTSGGEASIT
jgi:hypothetical protein